MKKTPRTMFILATTVTLPLLIPATAAADPPPPDGVSIEIITVNGACPGTGGVAISHDKSSMTVTGDAVTASVGGDSPPSAARKTCSYYMKIHVPQGYTYGIRGVEQGGTAKLEAGASGKVTQKFYFQGTTSPTGFTHTLNGPYDNTWNFRDTTDPETTIYKPCGELRNLNLTTELQANLGTSDPSKVSFISNSSPSGASKATYYFAWKNCPG
ncbi:DUF4360 domain-containing protein [Actinomadura macra]|uniref:DUF4360 domain-containing protein n=1 Tax=Actinomadura macra TaxID=46164 RepID=UPI000A00B0E9|nr:DUF4360 domain-containing protein [Actinomadura macra]